MPTALYPTKNRLLAALPSSEYAMLRPHLELTAWTVGTTLCTGGCFTPFLYFPATGIAGLRRTTGECRFSEVAVTGNDGVVGCDLLLVGDSPSCRVDVLCAGHAYRLSADVLAQEFALDSPLQQLLLGHTQSMIRQIARTAACNRSHALVERLCRWLLGCLDRMPSRQLCTTPAAMAASLAADEAEVVDVLAALERKGVLVLRPDYVGIHDRLRLEARACECHALINSDAMRWLPCDIAA